MNRRIARAMRVALASMVILVLCASSALAFNAPVWINTTTKVYQTPSTSARWLPAKAGLSVTMTAYANGWARVVNRGITAYIPLKYITLKSPIPAYIGTNSTIYRYAGSSAMGTGTRGTPVYVIGVDGGYARIMSLTGKAKGYIASGALTRTKPTVYVSAGVGASPSVSAVPTALRSTTTSPSASKIEYAIYVAQNLVGAPYAESANPPATFDCAKFAYYCFSKAGGSVLSGSSYSQGYDERYQMITSIASLQRGDLVFFDTVEDSDLCDHVGIYLGGGYFIHASSAAKSVIVSSLSTGYYNRTFSWGRRVFAS